MSDMSMWLISVLMSILLVQLLNLGNLHSETSDLVPQNFEVIHATRIAHLDNLSVGCPC